MNKTRKYIANKLAALALWIHPESEVVHKFYRQQMIDAAICGQSIVRIDPFEYYVKADNIDKSRGD